MLLWFSCAVKLTSKGLYRPIIFADFRRRYRTLTPLDCWIDHLDHIIWFIENIFQKSPNLNIDPVPKEGHLFFACTCYLDSITVSRFGSVGVFILGQTCWYFKLCYCLTRLKPWVKVLSAGYFFLKLFLIFTIISKACHLIYDIRPLVHHNYEKRSSKSNGETSVQIIKISRRHFSSDLVPIRDATPVRISHSYLDNR